MSDETVALLFKLVLIYVGIALSETLDLPFEVGSKSHRGDASFYRFFHRDVDRMVLYHYKCVCFVFTLTELVDLFAMSRACMV